MFKNKFFKKSKYKIKRSKDLEFLILFTSQLSEFLETNINIKDSISIIMNNTRERNYNKILKNIIIGIDSGNKLSDELKKSGFPNFYVKTLKIGEESGEVKLILKKIEEYYNQKLNIILKLKNILTYPIFLIFSCFISILFILLFVIPNLSNFLLSSGMEISNFNKLMFYLSYIVNKYINLFPFLLLAILILIYVFEDSVMNFLNQQKIKLPIIRKVFIKSEMIGFFKKLKIILDSGISLQKGLDIIINSEENIVLKELYINISEDIYKGKSFMNSVNEDKWFFSNISKELLFYSDNNMDLRIIVNRIIIIEEKNLEKLISKILFYLEPSIILFIGLMVLLIILSVILPVLESMNSII